MPQANQPTTPMPRTMAAGRSTSTVAAKTATRRVVKIGPLLLIACLALAIIGVLAIPLVVKGTAAANSKPTLSETAPLAYTNYENSADALSALGLSDTVLAGLPQDVQVSKVSVVDDSFLELTLTYGKNSFLYRTAFGSDDLSGVDYDTIAYTAAEEDDGVTIGYAGVSDKKLNAAVWISGEHSYALVANNGVDSAAMKELAATLAA